MPSIKEKLEKSKGLVKYLKNGWFFGGFCLILVVVAVFGSFKLVNLFKIQNVFDVRVVEAAFPINSSGKAAAYVASKTGSSYYFPWCAIAGRIKVANKIWFASRKDAEKAGYKPATNCHGLE